MQNYIFGAGGHGKVVLDAMQLAGIACAGFVDDRDTLVWAGLSVCQMANIELNASLHLAVGNCKAREFLADQLKHLTFFSVTHPTAVVAKTAKVGTGTLLAAQSIVAPDAQIGRHCIINHSAVIDHDCIVGDYCHIAPQASLGGGAIVGIGVRCGSNCLTWYSYW